MVMFVASFSIKEVFTKMIDFNMNSMKITVNALIRKFERMYLFMQTLIRRIVFTDTFIIVYGSLPCKVSGTLIYKVSGTYNN